MFGAKNIQIGLQVELGIWYMEPRWMFIYQLHIESYVSHDKPESNVVDNKNYEWKVLVSHVLR